MTLSLRFARSRISKLMNTTENSLLQPIELTVEQQLQLKVLENHIQGLSQK
ncbi:MAG TPA: hypothetical protein V6D48_17670 [Oculatellaceae cyanobacterium]